MMDDEPKTFNIIKMIVNMMSVSLGLKRKLYEGVVVWNRAVGFDDG